jgi:hypothetical protein
VASERQERRTRGQRQCERPWPIKKKVEKEVSMRHKTELQTLNVERGGDMENAGSTRTYSRSGLVALELLEVKVLDKVWRTVR